MMNTATEFKNACLKQLEADAKFKADAILTGDMKPEDAARETAVRNGIVQAAETITELYEQLVNKTDEDDEDNDDGAKRTETEDEC